MRVLEKFIHEIEETELTVAIESRKSTESTLLLLRRINELEGTLREVAEAVQRYSEPK